jgi:hypothetical protein
VGVLYKNQASLNEYVGSGGILSGTHQYLIRMKPSLQTISEEYMIIPLNNEEQDYV